MSMEIPRDDMMQSLKSFALSNSGVVVGLPGVGKTYSFRKLASLFDASDDLYMYIPIDKLDVESDDQLRTELGLEEDVVSYLKRYSDSSGYSSGVLLIDAFDAARSTRAQQTLLRLISRIGTELADFWNVVVSVRTYDARKSHDLQELFPA